LRVALPVFVRDYLRWSGPRVQITKATIAGEYVTQMVARLKCGVLAVPVHSAYPDINYRAPTPQWQNKSKLPSFSPHLSTATSPQIAAQVLEIGVGEFLRLRRAHSEQYDGWKNRKHTNVALRGFGLRSQNQRPVGGSIP
jgi:hypothetical protein